MNQVFMLQSELLKALGMSMIHSLWEGVLILLTVILLLALIRKEKSGWRYLVLYSGLMAMLVLFVLTFLYIYLVIPVHASAETTEALAKSAGIRYISSSSIQEGTSYLTGRLDFQVQTFLDGAAPLLALIWIAGFLATSTRLLTGMYTSRVYVRKLTFEPDPRLLELFDKVRRLLKVTFPVSLKMSTKKISPMVTGIIKPVVIVPIAALANLSPTQVESILAHEIAHIRRYDHLFLLLQEVAKGILFFHPLTWYLSNGINLEREHCCDDLVLKTYTDPIDYIKALTMVQEMSLAGMNTANAALGRPGKLLARIRRLIRPQIQTSPLPRLVAILALLLSAGLLLATTFRKPEDAGQSTAISAVVSQPDDSNRVEVMISIDADENRQDTSVGMVTKSVYLYSGNEGYEMKEIEVRMSNDSIEEIRVNGELVPVGEYMVHADTVASLRGKLIEAGGRRTIVLTDSLFRGPDNARKEIEVIIKGVSSTAPDKEIDSLPRDIDKDKEIEIIIRDAESSTLNRAWMDDLMADLYLNRGNLMPYMQQFKTLQADSASYYNRQLQLLQLYGMNQPDTGRSVEFLRQQYFEQLKKAQEEAQLSMEEMKRIQEEAAERAAEMARDQAARAREQAAQARDQAAQANEQAAQAREQAVQANEQAREQMERLKAEQEAARQKMQEEMKKMQEEMPQKLYELQERLKEFQEQYGDSLLHYMQIPDDLEVFVPYVDHDLVFQLLPVPDPQAITLPEVPLTGEPFYLALPEIPQTGEPFYFALPETINEEESISDPAKMNDLNSTLQDLEK